MDSEYCNSYNMCWGTLGTVRPFSNFHPDRDVMAIKAALENKDTVTLVRILTNRSNAQRQVIAEAFKASKQKDIVTALKKAVSGDLVLLLVELLIPSVEYEAYRFQEAMAKELVQRIMVSHSEEDLLCIRAAFIKLTGNSLYTALQKHFKGDYLQALLAICRSED
ncbi:annexin A2 [Archocentrus centrarchus]|uniref:annexin A2 n=1 Tax=Archocentrus centrarchus TaxID=63155 RepID=UPI0011EA4AC7|nr:annexin A2-like [Archocentrus centrarchus]